MTDTPRLAPIPVEGRDPRTDHLLALLRFDPDGPDLNLFTTLAHHPRLLKRWSAFGGLLLAGGALPGRDREVLILRTAANCGADYEWGHHVGIGRAVGLTDAEIEALAGPEAAAVDATLVRAADELHADAEIADATWAELAERYDEAQLVEVPMVVGQYHLVAFTLRSLRIQPEGAGTPIPGRAS